MLSQVVVLYLSPVSFSFLPSHFYTGSGLTLCHATGMISLFSLLTYSFAARYCLLADIHSHLSLEGPPGPGTMWHDNSMRNTLCGTMMAATTPTQHNDSAPNTTCGATAATAKPNMALHALDLLGLYVLVDWLRETCWACRSL